MLFRSVGPLSLRGNVFFDGTLALLTAFGIDTDPWEGLFPMSPIDRINDEIAAAFGYQTQVLGELIAAEEGAIVSGLELTGPYEPDSALSSSQGNAATGRPRIPEPATLALTGLLILPCLRRRS